MLEYVVKQEILFWSMAFLLGIGTMAKLVSAITTRKMVRAAGDIHKSNHRLMKLIKAKFEHACMISDKVQNVEAFVDKYIYETSYITKNRALEVAFAIDPEVPKWCAENGVELLTYADL